MTVGARLRNLLLGLLAGLLLVPVAVSPLAAQAETPACPTTEASEAKLATCLLFPAPTGVASWPGFLTQLGAIDVAVTRSVAEKLIKEVGTALPDLSAAQYDGWKLIYGPERLARMIQYQQAAQSAVAELAQLVTQERNPRPELVLPEYRGEPAGSVRVPADAPPGWSLIARQRGKLGWWTWQFSAPEAYTRLLTQKTARAKFLADILGPRARLERGKSLEFSSPYGSYRLGLGADQLTSSVGFATADFVNPNYATKPDLTKPDDARMFAFDPALGMVTAESNIKTSRWTRWMRMLRQVVLPVALSQLGYLGVHALVESLGGPANVQLLLQQWGSSQLEPFLRTGKFDMSIVLRELMAESVAAGVRQLLAAGWRAATIQTAGVSIDLFAKIRIMQGDFGIVNQIIRDGALGGATGLAVSAVAEILKAVIGSTLEAATNLLGPTIAAKLQPLLGYINLALQTALLNNYEAGLRLAQAVLAQVIAYSSDYPGKPTIGPDLPPLLMPDGSVNSELIDFCAPRLEQRRQFFAALVKRQYFSTEQARKIADNWRAHLVCVVKPVR